MLPQIAQHLWRAQLHQPRDPFRLDAAIEQPRRDFSARIHDALNAAASIADHRSAQIAFARDLNCHSKQQFSRRDGLFFIHRLSLLDRDRVVA
jgi:hypothetical protein